MNGISLEPHLLNAKNFPELVQKNVCDILKKCRLQKRAVLRPLAITPSLTGRQLQDPTARDYLFPLVVVQSGGIFNVFEMFARKPVE